MAAKSQEWPRVRWSAKEKAWMVDGRIAGKGARKFYRDQVDKVGRLITGRDLAEDAAKELRANRAEHGRLSVVRATETLAEYGKTVADAVQYYLAYLRAQARSIPIAAVIEELHAVKKAAGLSKRYQLDLKMRLSKLAEAFPDKLASEISTKDLDAWLSDLGLAPWTRNTFRRDARTLFSFAVKRGYCERNPAEGTEIAKAIEKPVQIFTTDEVQDLLKKCPNDMIPYFAIGCFAGLRSAELAKLDWSEIRLNEGHLEVTAAKAKTRRRRLVHLSDNLIAWLKPYEKPVGRVVVNNLPRRLRAACRGAGYGKPGSEDKEEKALGIVLRRPWPTNAMRHSFGSYHLAKHKDAAKLALEMGNSPEMIFAHYREVVRPAEAEKFWAITPKKELHSVSSETTT
jgi:integrase